MILPCYPSQIAALGESNQPYEPDRYFYHLCISMLWFLLRPTYPQLRLN